jgi:hypothetical protein
MDHCLGPESGLMQFEEIRPVPMLKRQQEYLSAGASGGWKVIRSFKMKSGRQSCALVATSSSASGTNRRKITHTST